MPLEAVAGALSTAPAASTPLLARWRPTRRDCRSAMRARAGGIARLATGALSKSMANASTSMTTSTTEELAVLLLRPRPRPLLSREQSRFATTAVIAAAASTSRSDNRSTEEDKDRHPSSSSNFSFLTASERGTSLLASLLSAKRKPGDVLLLYGDVGAGKSAFARAFIRSAARDEGLPVPSPTFLLHNVYDESVVADRGPTIHHFDLYRLGGTGGGRVSSSSREKKRTKEDASSSSSSASSLSALDAERCGLAEALGISSSSSGSAEDLGGGEEGVSLVEWADRLGSSSSLSSSSSSPSASSPSDSFVLPDDRVLEVAIEPLQLERARELSGRHPRLSSEAEKGGEEESEEEEDFDEFADTRWRLISLRPRGARALEAAREASRALRELSNGGEEGKGRGVVAIEETTKEEES